MPMWNTGSSASSVSCKPMPIENASVAGRQWSRMVVDGLGLVAIEKHSGNYQPDYWR
jgi:hypothetical protein